MSEQAKPQDVRFGRTVIAAAPGKPIDQPVQAVIYAANSRGLMGAEIAGTFRMGAGPDVEREAMAAAPHELGDAFLTSPGNLRGRGIEAIIHAVVAANLGDPPRLPAVREALSSALRVADDARLRTIALPLLGLPAQAEPAEQASVTEALVDEIVAFLRRGQTRIERIVIAAGLVDAGIIGAALVRARERSWVPRS